MSQTNRAQPQPLRSTALGVLLVGLCLTTAACDFSDQSDCSPTDTSALRSPATTWSSPNVEDAGFFGRDVAVLGDVNGDGTRDVAIGGYGESVGGTDSAGRVYVFGGTEGTLLHTLTSPHASEHGYFGKSVAQVGDADGDGAPDVLVAAPGESVKGGGCGPAGRVYLFSGTSGEHRQTFESPNPESPGNFGKEIAGRSAPDGSGPPSLLVGAPSETVDGKDSAGRAYLFPARSE